MAHRTRKQIKADAKAERKRRIIRWSVDGGYNYTWIEEKRSFFGIEYWAKIVQNRPYKRVDDPNEKIYKLLCMDRVNYKSNLETPYSVYCPAEEGVDGVESKETMPWVLKDRR